MCDLLSKDQNINLKKNNKTKSVMMIFIDTILIIFHH